MTRAELLAELRIVLDDEATPYGWADATLTNYLAEGQDVFCERTGYFRDSANYSLTLIDGTAIYDIPDRVIQILDIWDGGRRLKKDLTGRLGDEDATAETSPSRWNTDKTTGSIHLWPTPVTADDGDSYTLQVWRYSVYDLAGDGAVEGVAAVPELPARLQRANIEWAASKAFRHSDLELNDKAKAKEHENAFNDYVGSGIAMFRRTHNMETRIGSDPTYRT